MQFVTTVEETIFNFRWTYVTYVQL